MHNNMIPYRNNRRFERELRDFRKFFDDDFNGGISVDIIEEDDKYIVKAELPGFKKEDIKVDVNNDVLTIMAEHDEEHDKKKHNYIRRERRYGSFARSFDLTGINGDEITGKYRHGLLTLDLPKDSTHEEPAPREIEIK